MRDVYVVLVLCLFVERTSLKAKRKKNRLWEEDAIKITPVPRQLHHRGSTTRFKSRLPGSEYGTLLKAGGL